jgi:hypothetical protein
MSMPCRWKEGGLGDFTGQVRFTRRFGVPRQIDPHERVWLTFAGVHERADIKLNGQLLGQLEDAAGPWEVEVTALLQDRNELTVEMEALTGDGGLYGEVALEVRCSAYLRGARTWATLVGATAHLHAAGEVAGSCATPLEVYVLFERATVGYGQVDAGQPFQIDCEGIPWEQAWQSDAPPNVRVDLVSGALILYTVEQPLRIADR